MPNTAVNSLPYPAYGVGADIPKDIQLLAEAVAPKLYRAEPLTTAQIAAIASPRIGQLVFNTDVGRSQEWNGTLWRPVGAGAAGRTAYSGPVTQNVYLTIPFFVGMAFDEVDFTVNEIALRALVGSTPGVGQLIGKTSPASGNQVIFSSPPDAVTPAPVFNGNVRNCRLDADGFVRFEYAPTTSGTINTSIVWRAR